MPCCQGVWAGNDNEDNDDDDDDDDDLLMPCCCQGVWAGSLEISPRPVLGNWNISVDVNGQIFTKEFQVAEYILPKFQVGDYVRC